ncbi:MAG: hypothetical protein J5850_02040 [Clostridia bacterium]|nr:hypothetical protein [Clostridia bacterium]
MNSNKNDTTRKKDEYIANKGKTDYVVTRSKKFKIVSFIISLLAAIVLWCVVTITNTTTSQIVFNSVPVTFRGEDTMKEKYGLIIRDTSIDNISVTVKGDSDTVNQLTVENVSPVIDLSSVNTIGVYTFTIDVSLPKGVTYSLSDNVIEVAVDKPETKVISVSSESIQLTNWIKDPSCTIVDQSINITKITLEGNSSNLERVAGVQIRTGAIGLLNTSMTVSAQIYLLDEQGAELDIPVSISTDAGKEGIVVSLTVYKEKVVNISVLTEHGYFNESQITLSPSTVMVYGEASVVDSIDSLQLNCDPINEKQIFTDTVISGVDVDLGQYADDIIVKNTDGNEFKGADIVISLASCESDLILAGNFELIGAPEGVSIVEEYLQLTVRTLNTEDASVMLRSLTSQPEKIRLMVNYDPDTPDKADVAIVFSDDYKSYVYEVGSYTVTLTADVSGNDSGENDSDNDFGEE